MTDPTWHKSSRSCEAHCVEVAWVASSRCYAEAHCVEVAAAGGAVLVRDSTDPDGPVLAFAPTAWRAFVDGLKP